MKRLFTAAIMLLVLAMLGACSASSFPSATQPPMTMSTRPSMTTQPHYTTSAPTYTSSATQPPTTTGNIGLSTGGAKDVNNFRDNIRNNFLPLPTDITYEGLFYDYFFDTGAVEPTDKLYSPSYNFAVTRDPFSQQTEYYLSVGLNSGLKESDFERRKLNLVIVLDSSGSMTENYNQYYYDRWGKQVDAYAGEGIVRKTKMQSAVECVVSILNQLGNGDRFALVTFNSQAFLHEKMCPVAETNMQRVKDRVFDIIAGGSTNQDAGMQLGTEQFSGFNEINNYEYENRMIVLTDAQPNTGDISTSGFLNTTRSNADRRIYTTFIGIGVDFNTQLIEGITKIKGANYYSVHSPREFRERVEDEFDYMVTPLVFDLRLNFDSDGWRIEKVFGSPEADAATGSLMRINTLFASKSEGGETKGGLVLLKLRKTSSGASERVYLRTTYEDRNGRMDGDESVIYLESEQPEYFDNTGIRKGVLLSRYAALLKNWMLDEREHIHHSQPWNPRVREDTGIIIPSENAGQWERTSLPLIVSPSYATVFRSFSRYFEDEMWAIGDETMEQEMDILDKLAMTGEGRRY
jgi:Ca-activated chloride channel family protein